MVRLSNHLFDLKSNSKKALVLFVTAGDQPISQLGEILKVLTDAGADVIEVGLPFSDPFGEGVTIQRSSKRSLDQGTTTQKVLDSLASIQLPIPIVTMGYYNPVLRFGLEKFASRLAEVGCGGSIISDLIPNEAHEWIAATEHFGIETIFLAAPTSTEERISQVCKYSSGFVYAVSRTGVTGASQEVPAEVRDIIAKIRLQTEKSICVGFGISRPSQVAMVCESADGAVVGSALVELLHTEWDNGRGSQKIHDYVKSLKSAIS